MELISKPERQKKLKPGRKYLIPQQLKGISLSADHCTTPKDMKKISE